MCTMDGQSVLIASGQALVSSSDIEAASSQRAAPCIVNVEHTVVGERVCAPAAGTLHVQVGVGVGVVYSITTFIREITPSTDTCFRGCARA